jgi:hypothetical protein
MVILITGAAITDTTAAIGVDTTAAITVGGATIAEHLKRL